LTLAKDKNETYGSPICRWEASATSQHYASLIARLAKESQAFTLAVSRTEAKSGLGCFMVLEVFFLFLFIFIADNLDQRT
jgi:hypothetical protein